MKKLVETAYNRSRQIIEQHAAAMERIALALLEREVLDGSEVLQLIDGKTLADVVPPPSGDGTQQVIKPESGRRAPGMLEGGPQPA